MSRCRLYGLAPRDAPGAASLVLLCGNGDVAVGSSIDVVVGSGGPTVANAEQRSGQLSSWELLDSTADHPPFLVLQRALTTLEPATFSLVRPGSSGQAPSPLGPLPHKALVESLTTTAVTFDTASASAIVGPIPADCAADFSSHNCNAFAAIPIGGGAGPRGGPPAAVLWLSGDVLRPNGGVACVLRSVPALQRLGAMVSLSLLAGSTADLGGSGGISSNGAGPAGPESSPDGGVAPAAQQPLSWLAGVMRRLAAAPTLQALVTELTSALEQHVQRRFVLGTTVHVALAPVCTAASANSGTQCAYLLEVPPPPPPGQRPASASAASAAGADMAAALAAVRQASSSRVRALTAGGQGSVTLAAVLEARSNSPRCGSPSAAAAASQQPSGASWQGSLDALAFGAAAAASPKPPAATAAATPRMMLVGRSGILSSAPAGGRLSSSCTELPSPLPPPPPPARLHARAFPLSHTLLHQLAAADQQARAARCAPGALSAGGAACVDDDGGGVGSSGDVGGIVVPNAGRFLQDVRSPSRDVGMLMASAAAAGAGAGPGSASPGPTSPGRPSAFHSVHSSMFRSQGPRLARTGSTAAVLGPTGPGSGSGGGGEAQGMSQSTVSSLVLVGVGLGAGEVEPSRRPPSAAASAPTAAAAAAATSGVSPRAAAAEDVNGGGGGGDAFGSGLHSPGGGGSHGGGSTGGGFLGVYLAYDCPLPPPLLEAVRASADGLLKGFLAPPLRCALAGPLAAEVATIQAGVPGTFAVVVNDPSPRPAPVVPPTSPPSVSVVSPRGLAVAGSPPGLGLLWSRRSADLAGAVALAAGPGPGSGSMTDSGCGGGAGPIAAVAAAAAALQRPIMCAPMRMPSRLARATASRDTDLPDSFFATADSGTVEGAASNTVARAAQNFMMGTQEAMAGRDRACLADDMLGLFDTVGSLGSGRPAPAVSGVAPVAVLTVQPAHAASSLRNHLSLMVYSIQARGGWWLVVGGWRLPDSHRRTGSHAKLLGLVETMRSAAASIGHVPSTSNGEADRGGATGAGGGGEDIEELTLTELLGDGASGVVLKGFLGTVPVATKLIEVPRLDGDDSDDDAATAAATAAAAAAAGPGAAGEAAAAARARDDARKQLDARRTLHRSAMELAALCSIQHVNILQLCDDNLAAVLTSRTFPKLLPYTLDTPNGTMRVADMRGIYLTLLEMALALRHLHSRRLVHRDLKPANILLKNSTADARGWTAKLGDFGFVTVLDCQDPTNADDDSSRGASPLAAAASGPRAGPAGFAGLRAGSSTGAGGAGGGFYTIQDQACGTVTHMAPEALKPHVRINASVDIYSYGILMWELVAGRGRRPFSNLDPESIPNAVLRGLRPVFPDGVPLPYRALAMSCWAPDPRQRPTAGDVVREVKGLLARISQTPGAKR
ncbi:hypothetical protein HYH03_014781 [Edaphochlamys debaryana]|uniref:Protein kinase domain-containing protein n=1 Tax=Edaphochlamys debaryana TaxID=47281 RepID=A0A836BT95_9CHLO|nr:hypothetical protein HYH03_014781 [Edaphochlamys debaryana]|eukprot:KAG2486613.1 hypothetical protein HYH03_014781 [Edaphochlamys debaryana]